MTSILKTVHDLNAQPEQGLFDLVTAQVYFAGAAGTSVVRGGIQRKRPRS